MAEQKVYIGSVGPMLYEDTDLLDDPDGDLSGATKRGITTTGGAYFGNGVVTASIDLLDTNASNTLSLIWNENDTVDRTLNLLVSGANRSLTLSGDSEIDQDLATTSTPTFVDLILSSPTYTMFNLSDPGSTQVPQWNYGTSSWEWTSGFSDLSTFTTDDLTEGVSNLYFPGFTDLSTDYGFTDNSSDWDTAYGWGDHTSAGYLTAASTGVTGDWTINSDLGDVTSKLIFGRTTGGNAEITWDGTKVASNKSLRVPRLGINVNPSSDISIYNSNGVLDTASNYYHFANIVIKTAGASDYQDNIYGIYNVTRFNQTGGEIGHLFGLDSIAYLDNGSVGAVGNTRNIYGGRLYSYMSGGTVTGNVYGGYSYNDIDAGTISGSLYGHAIIMDQESASTLTGDAIGLYLRMDVDSDPGGTAYGIYFSQASNIDWFLYHPATAPSYHNGAFAIGTASFIGSEKLRVNGDGYFDGDLTAASYADNTPWFEGDAISEIMKISGKDGQLDHSTLSNFTYKEIVRKTEQSIYYNPLTKSFSDKQDQDYKYIDTIQLDEEYIEPRRDLSATVSELIVAFQQLYNEFQTIKSKGVKYA